MRVLTYRTGAPLTIAGRYFHLRDSLTIIPSNAAFIDWRTEVSITRPVSSMTMSIMPRLFDARVISCISFDIGGIFCSSTTGGLTPSSTAE